MNNILKKIKAGNELTSEERIEFLLRFHKLHTGITYNLFKNFKNDKGLNSYQLVCKEIQNNKLRKVKVLDIGCGNGILSQYSLENVSEQSNYIGIDISPEQIQLAATKYGSKNITFKIENSDKLSFKNAEFDYVISHLNLMLLNPIEHTLYQINRVLKIKGYFIALINSRNIQDDFLKSMLIFSQKFILTKHPNIRFKNLGDYRSYNIKGMKDILNAFPKLSMSVEEQNHELKCSMDSISLWNFIKSSYNVFCLSQENKNELKEIVLRAIEKEKGKSKFDILYPFKIYKFRKLE